MFMCVTMPAGEPVIRARTQHIRSPDHYLSGYLRRLFKIDNVGLQVAECLACSQGDLRLASAAECTDTFRYQTGEQPPGGHMHV